MKKEEIVKILAVVVIMAIILCFNNWEFKLNFLGNALAYSIIILFVYVIGKKIIAYFIDIKIEHKIWTLQRWGLPRYAYFKKPIPAGFIFPIILSLISAGFVKCFLFMQYDAEALPSKIAGKYKYRGYRKFQEITEWEFAMISFFGIIFLLALSVFSFYFGENILSKYSLYFALWNLTPISSLDGSKIFFGSKPLYVFTLILSLIAVFLIFPALG